jgi:hypothetical protein
MGLREGIPYGDHKVGFAIDLDCVAYFDEMVQSSSHKNKNKVKNETSLGENRKAPLDDKIVKIKDESTGENLSEVPKDGGLEFLPVQ